MSKNKTHHPKPLESIRAETDTMEIRLLDALEQIHAETAPFRDEERDAEWIYGLRFSGRNAPYSESFFAEAREVSRGLVMTNPYAVGAIENRVNFVVGTGHRYHAIPCSDEARPLAHAVQDEIDDFIERNQWYSRQQEIQRRKDRDGEIFLRFFTDSRGRLVVRFVEPEQVAAPTSAALDDNDLLGIRTEPGDVERSIGYWIDGTLLPAKHIQHRKNNVDANVKRGIPLLWPVRKNLVRAEKLLRNMSVVAEIQSAIALIRKHSGASADTVRKYLRNSSEPRPVRPIPYHQRFAPGTVIDASGGVDYQFPIAAINAARYIQILQAELRAIAARLAMPEYMLSCDASNSNYASTLVAEGPAIRMFERLQTEMIRDDLAMMRRVLRTAVAAGRIPEEYAREISIQAIPPTLAVRDRLAEAKADEILLKNGIISPQTMAMRYGLDPEKETNIRAHCPSCFDLDDTEE